MLKGMGRVAGEVDGSPIKPSQNDRLHTCR